MRSGTRLTGRVIFKGDQGYETARKNWDPHTDKFPKVFVFAQKTQDVANAIKWANENKVPIRARSGRHSLEVNLSQVTGGIVIDVSEMKKIKLNKKSGTVVVGTGNTVGRIAHTLAGQGYMAPFGDSPTVGIGGITLGGGIGPLQRTVGLVSDNLIELEMVDAKGKIIRANKNSNSDLLWASRGGGGGISEFTPVTNSKYVLLQLRLPFFVSPGLGISSRRYSKLGNSGLLALIPNWAVNYPLVRKKAVMSL